MIEIYYLALIVAVFSVIQSIFGVGLLLFGTPTLLLLGYSYTETLWLLLPCSVTISLIQVVSDYKLIESKKRAVYLIIPTLILSLIFVVIYENNINIAKVVGVFLLLIAIVRFSKKLQVFLSLVVKKYISMYYIVIGFEHGISNMGGGPLSILMTTLYSKKEVIRVNVAFIYLILAVFQLIVLSIISNSGYRDEVLWLIVISLASYFYTNKFISPKVNNKKYLFILNVIVLVYGVLALIK